MTSSSRAALRAWRHSQRGETRRRRRALTFVEIMVAVVIMVAAFFPLISMMRSGVRRAKFQKIRAFGTSLVQNLIERMRGMSIFYLEFEQGSDWWNRAEQLGHGHLAENDDWNALIDEDPILVPTLGVEGVPDDEEFKTLIEGWNKRYDLFYLKPHWVSASWRPELARNRMAILAVTTSWKDDFQRKETLDALKADLAAGILQGGSSLTMFAIIGEGLFHAASEGGPPDASPGG